MCEPYHSIVQYPERDEHDNDQGPKISGLGARALDFMKKVKSWFHFSKMGSGHSEAIRANRVTDLWLPPDTRYEVAWWNRTVKRDGAYHGHGFDAVEALECAEQYAKSVSIGDLGQLRRFLSVSLVKTERPHSYVEQFRQILNPQGRRALDDKMKWIGFDEGVGYRWRLLVISDQVRERIVKSLVGLTRKRHLLVPEWADDKTLWTPDQWDGGLASS